MNITAEEKLMYEVMKAVCESGIPINFKGSMVLRACLMEAGYPEEIRHTEDIDANWNSDMPPSDEQIMAALQEALAKAHIGLDVSIYRKHGEGRSAGFDLTDQASGESLFTMDIDVNRPAVPTRIYEAAGFRFRGVVPNQMIADKIAVVSGEKVFRRIKDVVDLYYLSNVFAFEKTEILERLQAGGRKLGDFHGFLYRPEELRHAYEKFRLTGDVHKPPFETVYNVVKSYIGDVLP